MLRMDHDFDNYPLANPENRVTVNYAVERLRNVYGNGESLHSIDRVAPDDLDAIEGYDFISSRLELNKKRYDHAFNAIVMGSFDVPQPCHEWYLRDCRQKAAERMLVTKYGLRQDEITVNDIKAALTYPGLKLTCIIDSDKTLNIRKGGVEEKGGIPRPVYAWRDRADRVAGFNYFIEEFDNVNHNVVDYVIKEGVEFTGTPMARIHKLAEKLKENDLLDAYIVYGEYPQSFENAKSVGFDGGNLILVPMPSDEDPSTWYTKNPLTGGNYHGSDIINAMRKGV